MNRNDVSTIVDELAHGFAQTAVARDLRGGTPRVERQAIRQSALLKLSIPTQYGGSGANWSDTLDVVRRFAQVDSSLAHVFGFHHLLLATLRLFARPAQWEPWLEETARRDWFWGNALNPLDRRTVATTSEGGREFNGKKNFCSGASDAEMLVVSALDGHADGKLLVAVLPSARQGITVHDDWDNFGQRQTDSGSVTFEQVRVGEQELLLDPGPLSTPFACLRPLIAQLHFTHVFLGLAEGAFNEARGFTRTESRPWIKSGVSQSSADPYVLHHFGDFWVSLEGVRVLTTRAAAALDAAWHRGEALTEDERGSVAVAIATAKVSATRVGLDLASRLFDVTGARATAGALRLDRYCRNLRTQTLHDPVDYKLRELGDWALNDVRPTPSFYS